jgi:hypothetical protein
MSVVHHIQSISKLSIVVTDTIPVVSNRPSGVALKRPDAARLLVTTAAIDDKLLFAWYIGVGSTPQRVHGRVVTSRLGTYVDYRFTLWCLFRGLREQYPTRVLYQGDRKQAYGV